MFVTAHWSAVGEFAASRHGVITRNQAAEFGFNKDMVSRRLRSGDLTEPIPRVLVVHGSVATWHQSLLVATLGSGGCAVAGYRSAAALHRLDGCPQGAIELVAPSPRRQLSAVATVRYSQLDAADIMTVDGVRTTSIARTLIDLATIETDGVIAQAFESAWRRGVGLGRMKQVAERLHRPGQRGSGVILELVNQAQAHGRPTESALEVRLSLCLTSVPGVVRQFQVNDSVGRFVARADFAVPSARIAVEAHSRQFHFGPRAVSADEEREHRMKAAGWDVLYFGHDSMRSPQRVARTVLAAIARRTGEVLPQGGVLPLGGSTSVA